MPFVLACNEITSHLDPCLITDVVIERDLYCHTFGSCIVEMDYREGPLSAFDKLAKWSADLLGKSLEVLWKQPNASSTSHPVICFDGYIQAIQSEIRESKLRLHLEFTSSSRRADETYRYRVFQDANLSTICHQVARESKGLIRLSGKAHGLADIKIPLSVQYNETDWAYLTRMCFAHGIPLTFDTTGKQILVGEPDNEGK